MDNIGTIGLAEMIYLTLFLVIVASALIFGILILRWKINNKEAAILAKELNYEIYYGKKRIYQGILSFKSEESKRFGFSKKTKYHNDIILENYLDKIEDLDEDDVERMIEEYGTWFDVKMFAGKFWVAAAYTPSEKYNGNKKIYLEDGILNHKGEVIEADIHIYSDKDRGSCAFRIDLYDESKKVE